MTTPNPTVIKPRQRLIPSGNLADLQAAYRVSRKPVRALGQRNPNSLPGVFKDSESVELNASRTKAWDRARKLVESGRTTGHKYHV